MDIDFQMSPVNVNVQRAISVSLAKDPIAIRGHAELFDFLLEGVDLFLRLLQSVYELLVLLFPLRQLLQRLMVFPFQRLVVANRFLQVSYQTLGVVFDDPNSLL
jgi:hypothetical protein